MREPDFVAGRYDTEYVPGHWPPSERGDLPDGAAAAAALVAVLAARSRVTRRAVTNADSSWARAGRDEALR